MSDHIQIGDIAPRVRYVGNGINTIYSYPFAVFTDADIEVYLDSEIQVLASDYSVSGAGASAGGSVTFESAPSGGAFVTIVRRLAISRSSDFQASGEFRAQIINDELDFQTAALQQLEDDVSRSVRLKRSDTTAGLELPDAMARSDRALTFDGDGNLSVSAFVDLTAGIMVSDQLPVAGTAIGSAGISTNVSAADHAHPLPDLSDIGISTQANAEAGVDNLTVITPLRAAQAIAALATNRDQIARDMAASALAYAMATNDATSITGSVGKFWLSDDFESDSITTKTNATYNAIGDYYSNPGYETTQSAAVEWAGGTGEYNLSDGDIEVTGNDNCIYTNDEFAGDFDFTFTYKTDELNISIIGIFEASNKGSVNANAYNQPFSGWFWTSRDSPSYLTDYETITGPSTNDFSMAGVVDGDIVTLGRSGTSIYVKVNGSTVHTFATTSSATLSIIVGQAQGVTGHILDVTWAIPSISLNMTLAPSVVTLATSDPTDIIAYVVIEPVDSITPGTDMVLTASIDGGTTDATGSWTKVGDIGSSGEELYRIELDVSAQTGSSLIYEITTANNKEIRLHDCVGLIANY